MNWRARNRDRLTVPTRLDERGQPYGGPTFTLDRQIDSARKDMGAARWAELNKEWNA